MPALWALRLDEWTVTSMACQESDRSGGPSC